MSLTPRKKKNTLSLDIDKTLSEIRGEPTVSKQQAREMVKRGEYALGKFNQIQKLRQLSSENKPEEDKPREPRWSYQEPQQIKRADVYNTGEGTFQEGVQQSEAQSFFKQGSLTNLVPEGHETIKGVVGAFDPLNQLAPETIKPKLENLLATISTDESEKKSIEQNLGLNEGINPIEENIKHVADSWEKAKELNRPDGTQKTPFDRNVEYISAIANTAFSIPMVAFSTLRNVPVVGEGLEQYAMKELVAINGVVEETVNALPISDYHKEKVKELGGIVGMAVLGFAHRTGKSPAEVVKENPPELRELVNKEVSTYIGSEFQLPPPADFRVNEKGVAIGKKEAEPMLLDSKDRRTGAVEVDRTKQINQKIEGALTEKLIEYENEILNPKKTADEIIELQNNIDKVKTKLEKVKEPTAKELSDNLKNELGELNKEIAERQKTETKPIDNGKEKVQEKGEVEKTLVGQESGKNEKLMSFDEWYYENNLDSKAPKRGQTAWGKDPSRATNIFQKKIREFNVQNKKDYSNYVKEQLEKNPKLKSEIELKEKYNNLFIEELKKENLYKNLKTPEDRVKSNKIQNRLLDDYLKEKEKLDKDTQPKPSFKLDLEKDGLTPETFWKDVQSKLQEHGGQTGIAKAYEQAKTRLSKLSDTALDASSLPFKVAEYLKDISIVGAYWINKGVRRIGDWTRKMTQELGDKAVPYLKDIWEGLNKPPQLREGAELRTMGISKKTPRTVETKQTERPKTLREFAIQNKGKIPAEEMAEAFKKFKETPQVTPQDTPQVSTEVNAKTPPRKISDAVTREIPEKESGFTRKQKMEFNIFNPFEPITRHYKSLKDSSPTVSARNWLKRSTYIKQAIDGKGMLIVGRDGNVRLEKGSVRDLVKEVKGQEKNFADYMVARRVVEDTNRLNELKSKEQTKEVVAQIEKIQGTLEKDNLDFKDAQRILDGGKDKFAKPEQMFDDMYKKQLTFAYETGLISKKQFDTYSGEKGYASFKRDMSDTNSPLFSTNSQAGLSSMKEREGSQRQILDPVFNLKNDLIETIGKGLENKIWLDLVKDSEKIPALKEHFPEVKPFTKEAVNGIKVWEDGKARFFNPAPEFREMWGVMRPQERSATANILKYPKNLFTRLTTSINPLFVLRNLTVDQFSALMNTKTGMKLGEPVFRILQTLVSPEVRREFRRYREIGGDRLTFASTIGENPAEFTKNMLRTADTKGQRIIQGVKRGKDKALDMLELPSNLSEQMTRFTEFLRAKKQGKSDTEALYLASEVTVPFEMKGAYSKKPVVGEWVDSMPYLNAQIQVLNKTYRAVKDNPVRVATVVASGIATGMSATMLTLSQGSDDQKRELSQMPVSELARNIFIPLPTGKGFFKLRIPETIGSLLAVGQLAMLSEYRKNTWKDYANAMMNILPTQINILEPERALLSSAPQTVKPTLEVVTNKKSYPELAPIVPEYMRESEKPSEQYKEYTTRLGKFMGDIFDVSPMLVDHWVKGQFGTVGSLLFGLPESLEKVEKAGLVTQSDKFIMSGVAYNNFYDKRKELTQEYNYIKDTDDSDKTKEIRRSKMLYDNVANVFSDANKIYKATKTIPDETRVKLFNLAIALQKEEPEAKILTQLEELSKQIEPLKEQTKINSNNKQFNKVNFELNLLENEKKVIEDKYAETKDKNLVPKYNQVINKISEIKKTEEYNQFRDEKKIDKTERNKELEGLGTRTKTDNSGMPKIDFGDNEEILSMPKINFN